MITILQKTPKFDVYTNHKNLQHLITTKNFNQPQSQWMKFFNKFNFTIHNVPRQKK